VIRRLTLENWRAYDRVELELEEGTTFVVARNGIGKTSLIEGAAWALYGEAAGRPVEAVRYGAKVATATVELVLPDGRVLELARPLPKRLTRTSATPAACRLDGAALSDSDAREILTERLLAEPGFLASLTMLRGLRHGLADEAGLSLGPNLSRLFNIDGLHGALDRLETTGKGLKRDIAAARQVTPPSATRLRALRKEADAAATQVALAQEEDRIARQAERDAEAAVEARRVYQASRDAERRRVKAVSELAVQATGFIAAPATDDGKRDPDPAVGLALALGGAEQALAEQVDQQRIRAAVLGDRIDRLQTALAELDAAGSDCPVCRRPLAAEDRQAAREGHQTELEGLRRDLTATDAGDAGSKLADVQSLQARLRPLQRQVPLPALPEGTAADEAEVLAAAVERTQAALDDLVRARSAADAAAAAVATAQEEEQADAALTALYRQQALISAATAATTAAVDTLTRQAVAPLEDELRLRWKTLFGDRGDLALRSGRMSRTVNGGDLPFAAFSDGEQTSAQLLLRLLVLGAATHAGFCWIDEPLEHLDPPARRQIASLLASTSGLKQVVVTTYEEPLARRLALRHPEQTRVLYIRPDERP